MYEIEFPPETLVRNIYLSGVADTVRASVASLSFLFTFLPIRRRMKKQMELIINLRTFRPHFFRPDHSAQQHALVRVHASIGPVTNSGRPRESSLRKQGAFHPVAFQFLLAAGVCVGERKASLQRL